MFKIGVKKSKTLRSERSNGLNLGIAELSVTLSVLEPIGRNFGDRQIASKSGDLTVLKPKWSKIISA